MKKILCLILVALLLCSLAGCGSQEPAASVVTEAAVEPAPDAETTAQPAEEAPSLKIVSDGRARPSSCGSLQVISGKLCSESGDPVMLRGVSSHGLIPSESFFNDDTFRELSEDIGANVFRIAMYTYGVGSVGYCTNGDKARHEEDVINCVNLARDHDMYAIIDWHILSDGDPNLFLDQAAAFFAYMAELFCDYNNVIYEICNEPNGVDWPTVKTYAEQIIPVIREKDPDSVILVGNPDWSKDLQSVADDPLEFDNILYSLHFYAATHGQDLRDLTERLSREGLPIFVTEYGVTASTGGFPRDLESADLWIGLLERENISYCMWSFSKAPEACSAVRSTVLGYSGFSREDYTVTGQWLLDTLAAHRSR